MPAQTTVDGTIGGDAKLKVKIINIDIVKEGNGSSIYYTLSYDTNEPTLKIKLNDGNITDFS